MNFYYGVVENRQDPLRLGRCQVRVVGLHTHDKSQLPTADLPWATPIQPVTSAAMNGIGSSPIGLVEGTSVVIMFADVEHQQPVILGTIGGIPSEPVSPEADDDGPISAPPKIVDLKLRTIPGPVTGKQLTFYDAETNATNLTAPLKADMKVLGFGMPEGTFIVSIDSGTQITINNPVTEYVENILSFEDAPTNLAAVNASKTQNVLKDSSGTPVTSGDGTPVATGSAEPSPVKQSATNSAIPTIPPPKSTSNTAKSEAGIKALIAACDKVGLTTREQKCALLGIAGGESRWIPQLEAFNYSANRMKQIYSFATPEDIATYSEASKKGLTRQQFFSWAYGPTKRGKGFLGNQTDADGGKYFGRGFIQLTGKANYARYQKLANDMGLNLDIVNNPDSLDNDINISALIAALYFKDRVKGAAPSAHPGYYFAAKKAVGVNSPDIAALKQSYYEYFYGGLASAGGSEKDAGAPAAQPPSDSTDSTPGPSEQSVRTGADSAGFRDPNSKYPLQGYIGEPDTNRLARGVIEGTVVSKKDSTRALAIPRALSLGSWDQPEAPYGAKYPFNKVFESESGHIQEFDDTPGHERIHTYHRSGTFQEIDANGTLVNYIVGDNYVLMEKNGCIHVSGECNITVDGNTNIYARTDANIQVDQNATIKVGNNLDIGVGTDVTMAIGGDFKVKVAGDYSIDAANINTKAQAALTTQAAGAMNIKGSTINQEAVGAANYLSGGTTNMDYSQGQFGNGAAGAKDVANVPLTPPEVTVGLSPIVPFAIPREREFEENTVAETPDDYDTPEGRAAAAEQARTEGVAGAPAAVASEEGAPPSGGSSTTIPVNCDIIFSRKDFSNDFRLSKNFTLGMLIDGGVGGKHRLIDQMLKETKSAPERLYTVQEIVCNLAQTAQNMLEPMLEILPGGISGYQKQWRINSGYRLRGVIKNESPTSDHCKGHAIDIGILLPNKSKATFDIIQGAEKILPYDQLILEYRFPSSIWIHCGYKPKGNRKMAFTMVNDSTFKRDASGAPSGFVLIDNIPPKSK